MRRILFLLVCGALSASGVAPAADAPGDDGPVMLGLSTPTGKDCSFTAQPGQPGYCLRPPDGMGIWLRADDIWTRVTILTAWKSPPSVRMSASHSGRAGEAAWLMPNEIAGLPSTRFADRSSLILSSPAQYDTFTLFAVARQSPGSNSGALVSSSESEGQGIGWSGGDSIAIRTGPGAVQKLPFAGAQQFHVLTMRAERGYAHLFANGQRLNDAPLALGSRFAMQFVGTAAQATGAGGLAALRGFSARAPANAAVSSDIAELIVWPRALDEDEMRTTLRYLRRKFQLGFAPDEHVMLAASPVPADLAAPAAPVPDDTGTKPGSPGDPAAGYPTTVGQQFARGSTCKSKALTPDQPGYCLYPTKGSVAWHRADDIFTFERKLKSWSSPLFNELLAPDESRQPELVNAQVGRYPVVRFDNDSSMDFRRPMTLPEYTIFLVGRRAPGAAVGPVFRLGTAGNAYLFWQDKGLSFGARGTRKYLVIPYAFGEQFHLIVLRGRDGHVEVNIDDEILDSLDLPEGSQTPLRFGHVGGGLGLMQSREDAIFDALKDGFSLSGGRERISSEIAEILVYDKMLEEDALVQTTRYLRKKYSLP
jgi:hypothetical protein